MFVLFNFADHSYREVWGINCLRLLAHWGSGFKFHYSIGVVVCVFILGLCCPECGQRPCDKLIPVQGMYMIRKLEKEVIARESSVEPLRRWLNYGWYCSNRGNAHDVKQDKLDLLQDRRRQSIRRTAQNEFGTDFRCYWWLAEEESLGLKESDVLSRWDCNASIIINTIKQCSFNNLFAIPIVPFCRNFAHYNDKAVSLIQYYNCGQRIDKYITPGFV
jgi:hypothetical protein